MNSEMNSNIQDKAVPSFVLVADYFARKASLCGRVMTPVHLLNILCDIRKARYFFSVGQGKTEEQSLIRERCSFDLCCDTVCFDGDIVISLDKIVGRCEYIRDISFYRYSPDFTSLAELILLTKTDNCRCLPLSTDIELDSIIGLSIIKELNLDYIPQLKREFDGEPAGIFEDEDELRGLLEEYQIDPSGIGAMNLLELGA